eukprot:TRINITY_DN39265_c0_g1_i1.p1 TRINITY_DN39265_c0_g1~~TRINITY_DN39265_c0_g1_i1.p1  ORF type:complete len:438 (-),score=86.42 TRINITY_DN39265_c0_g1_i1:210-1523(-)
MAATPMSREDVGLQLFGAGLEHLTNLYYVNKLRYEDVPENEVMSNRQIAQCEHAAQIFKRTRVPDFDSRFYDKVCKRSYDACTKHPVIFIGQWGQGKSSLVNALLEAEAVEANKEKRAKTGRHSRTTTDVQLYSLDAGEDGSIILADTPGLEPDKAYDIFSMFRGALQKENLSPDVLTDYIVLVIAGNAQGIRTLSCKPVLDWIHKVYMQARGSSALPCTLQPVVTHLDQIDVDDLEGDKSVIRDRLKEVASSHMGRHTVQCAGTQVMDPIFVCNPDGKKRSAEGVKEFMHTIRSGVRERSGSLEFKLQWSRMLTQDLEASLLEFSKVHPFEETKERLFHRAVDVVLLTYGKRPLQKVEHTFPTANWQVLHMLERKLRGEESPLDRVLGGCVGWCPCPPRDALPVVLGLPFCAVLGKVYKNRIRFAKVLEHLLRKVK